MKNKPSKKNGAKNQKFTQRKHTASPKISRILQILSTLILSSFSYVENDECKMLSSSYEDYNTLRGLNPDSNKAEHANTCKGNKFTFAVIFYLYGVNGQAKKGLVFSYHNKVKIYFQKLSSGAYELRVWKQGEPGDGVIHRFDMGGQKRFFLFGMSSVAKNQKLRSGWPLLGTLMTTGSIATV